MKCPDCAAVIDPQKPDCPGCGAKLLAAFERKAWGAKAKEAAPPRAALPAARAAMLFGAGAALGLVVGFARAPEPLPAQAYVDSARGFSVALTAGWRVEPLAGSGFGDALRLTDGPASIVVARLSPEESPETAAAAQFAGAKLSAPEDATLSGSSAKRYAAEGERAYLPSSAAGSRRSDFDAPAPAYESQPWRGEAVVGAGFAVRSWSERDDFEKRRDAFAAFVSSFRAISR